MSLVDRGLMLPLMEEFYTIQGEGYHKGTAAYFIRIGGCDVGCHWCDVKESWDADIHPPTAIESIVENAASYSDTIVVTGGEPLTWDMGPLTEALKLKNLKIHIETSGAYPLTGIWDWIYRQRTHHLMARFLPTPTAQFFRHDGDALFVL